MLSYVGQGKAQVSPEGRRDLNQVVGRQPQVLAVGQPLVIAHVVGLVLTGREPGARGGDVMGDAFGGELDGLTLVLKICQQLSADVLQRSGGGNKVRHNRGRFENKICRVKPLFFVFFL